MFKSIALSYSVRVDGECALWGDGVYCLLSNQQTLATPLGAKQVRWMDFIEIDLMINLLCHCKYQNANNSAGFVSLCTFCPRWNRWKFLIYISRIERKWSEPWPLSRTCELHKQTLREWSLIHLCSSMATLSARTMNNLIAPHTSTLPPTHRQPGPHVREHVFARDRDK